MSEEDAGMEAAEISEWEVAESEAAGRRFLAMMIGLDSGSRVGNMVDIILFRLN